MKRFAELFLALESTNKTNEKLRALANYFSKAPPEDAVWVLYLLLGRRPRRVIPPRRLAAWACAMADIPEWLFEECLDVVGDFAETVSLILNEERCLEHRSLHRCIEEGILRLPDLTESEQRSLIVDHWRTMDQTQRLLFNKLMTGQFRVGVSDGLVVRALAQLHRLETSLLSHRLMGNWEPNANFYRELLREPGEETLASRPYPFFLAHPLTAGVHSLGEVDRWAAEWKWDGIRAQLVRRQRSTYLWSRGEELVTDRFPEIEEASKLLPDGTVLDGEILPFVDGQVLPFATLQRRIGRKQISTKILSMAPVILMAYDLLEERGEDQRSFPLSVRRQKLEALLSTIDFRGIIQLSARLTFASWEELEALRSDSRAHHVEGIMLKRVDSPYRVGRVRGDWWKWKIDPLSMDAVLIMAQRGSGKRAALYTDYTFGVWKDDVLVPVAKAYSGLTDEEILEVDRFVRQNITERFGPVRGVKPELVFEIGFDAIARSPRHKSGLAVRFPRMLRWRRDKRPEDADRLETLVSLLPPVEKGRMQSKGKKQKEESLPLFDDQP